MYINHYVNKLQRILLLVCSPYCSCALYGHAFRALSDGYSMSRRLSDFKDPVSTDRTSVGKDAFYIKRARC